MKITDFHQFSIAPSTTVFRGASNISIGGADANNAL